MFTKLSLSIAAAISLSAAPGIARAAPSAGTTAREQYDAAEAGDPDSVGYDKRMSDPHSPTNDDIDADEAGNPHSVDNGKQGPSAEGNVNADWLTSESADPDRV